jgi:bifunctional DNase/RNase
MLEVKVETVAQDLFNRPVVILREPESNRVLPIWIGQAEAWAIALELRGEKPPRPLTHDLMRNILEQLGVRVVKVVIHDLIDSTYYATIYLEHEGKSHEIDSRPSDALALALRTNAPIYITGNVVESLMDLSMEDSESERNELERFRRLMQQLEEEMGEEAH